MKLKLSKLKGLLPLLFVVMLVGKTYAHSNNKGVFNKQQVISGIITDDSNMPLPGVTILIKGTKTGTSSDFDGNYSITAKTNDILVFSFMGFKTKEIKVTSSTNTINVQLTPLEEKLGEVVLIGYGSAKKRNITTAVANVNNIKDINSRPVSSLKDFLQGNVAGVTVLQDGGDPSRRGNIVIRGLSSTNISNPLTIVDGVPYYGPPINPNDIEAISVLKDASAQAIYGAQAGNGVIVIKTKKGRLGKTTVNINYNSGLQVASNLPTPLNAKEQSNVYNIAANNARETIASAHIASKNPWGQVTRTNWIKAIFRPAEYTNFSTSISGASEKINYMASIGYNKKQGILVGTKSDRYSIRLKSEFNVTNKLTFGENIYYSRTEAVGANTSSGYSGAVINAMYMPSAAPVRDSNGNFHGVAPYKLKDFAGAYGDVYNPVALLLRPTTKNPTNNINANIFGKYEILSGLTFKSSFGYSFIQNKYKRFSPRRPELGRTNKENYLVHENSDKNIWTWDNHLNYKKSFGNHNLDISAIYSSQHTNDESIRIKGTGFSSEDKNAQYMANASNVENPKTTIYEDALTSAIGRIMYNYDNRYFIAGSLRRDESSRLFANKQYEYFPATSFGWNISNESFFNVNFINYLKFRASWGQIGNLSSITPYRSPLMKSTTVNLGEDGLVNDTGKYLKNRVNYDLKWERIESKNIGLDAEFFDRRLALTLDYFEKTTKGMVLNGQDELHWGTSNDFVNGGDVLNKGYEISASYKDHFGNLGLKINTNATFIKNKVLNLDGYGLNAAKINHTKYRVRDQLKPIASAIGQPLYSYNLIPCEGIFKNDQEIKAHSKEGNLIQPNAVPGDLKFTDTNNDGKINNDDRVFMGSYQPKVTYNVGINLDYKGFDLGLLFQGVGGVKIFNAYKYSTYNAALQGYNLDNRVLNAWSKNNTKSNIPRLSVKDNNANFSTTSNWYLENGDYLKLKNLSLGYTFSKNQMSFMKNSTLRAYFSAENVFTITKYSGMDPEVSLSRRGIDMGEYPVSRIFSIGLSLKL